MVTIEQAQTARHFESVSVKNADGTPLRARANGKCRIWKTRPGEFSLPVKHGLYQYFYITHETAQYWNVAGAERA